MRKTPVRTLRVIQCANCGTPCIRFPPGVFCPPCKRQRNLANQKERRIRAVTRDPDFYRKQNDYKNRWKHERTKARGPVRCVVCGKEMPRIRGRHDSNALCPRDRVLNRRFNNQVARVAHMKALPPHPCVDCGVPVSRIRGLRPEWARCLTHRRLHRNKMHRANRARARARLLAQMPIAV